jgi:hypothetical protein
MQKDLTNLDFAPLLMFSGVIERAAVAGKPPSSPERIFAYPIAST